MRRNYSQYGYHFNEFLDMVECASLTLKREPKPDGEGLQETCLFNYHQSVGRYWDSLMKVYTEIGPHANHIIASIPNKVNKLNYLTGLLAEIKGIELLLNEDANGQFKHTYFTYTDVSDEQFRNDVTLGQDVIQDYLVTLKRYIVMVRETIEGIKQNIELIPQSELPIPESQRPKAYDSTHEIPDKFLDYLIVKNGVNIIKNQFKPVEDEYDGYDYISYDEKTETKVYHDRDYDTGEPTEIKISFPQHLLNLLATQVNLFKNLVDEKISQLKSIDEIRFYITVVSSRIKYLNEVYNNSSSLKKYENLGDALKAFIRHLYQKYPDFCPEKDHVIEDALKGSKLFLNAPKPELLPQSKTPKMFRWAKGSPQRLNVLLHAKIAGSFIEDVDLIKLSKIFDGGYTEHSPAIKWIDKPKNNSSVNKVNLLYLFKKLAEAGLIDIKYDSPEMLLRIEYIFTDAKGDRLKHWAQSKKSVEDKKTFTSKQVEIDKIVALLSSEAAI